MPFSETIKQKVKQRAHYRCCLCRKNWVADVHHIIPESEGGANTEDNAAPLCANCHDLYGGNPDKRKFIKENRDFWYDFCEKHSRTDTEQIQQMLNKLGKFVATKEDLKRAVSYLDDQIHNIMGKPLSTSTQLQQISDVTATFSDVISTAGFPCSRCGKVRDINGGFNFKCPYCGYIEAD